MAEYGPNLFAAWQNGHLPYNIRSKVGLADGINIRKLSQAYLDEVNKEVNWIGLN